MGQYLTDTSIEGVKEFVSFYPERTQKQYISAIKIFMLPYYPQLSVYKRGEGAAMLNELDALSIQYVQEVKTSRRDFKQDLLNFKKSIQNLAPKTRYARAAFFRKTFM